MGRIFVTGDTHGSHDIRKLNNKKFPQQNMLTKDDYVIICGDFGLVWDESAEEKYWQKWLDEKNFTTLFVAGNHENHDLLNQYPVENWNGGKIHRITDSIIHLMHGQVFTVHNKTFFTMGGAKSADKKHRVEGISWWKEEIPSYQAFEEGIENLEKQNYKVDYIITHTAPQEIIEKRYAYLKDYDVSLNHYLTHIKNSVDYKGWYFGHMHVDDTIDNFHMLYLKVKEIK